MGKLRYRLTYTVAAHDRLSAVMAAGGMLRKNVTVDELVEAIPVYLGWWDVTLAVSETFGEDDPPEPAWDMPESADPVTAGKGWLESELREAHGG